MTDQSPPRPTRANPAPRRALPRVTPLAAVPEDDERVLWAAAHSEGSVPTDHGQPATGRDLLIPNGPAETGRAKPADKPGRKRRNSMPAVSELMPPSTPRRKKHGRPAREEYQAEPAAPLASPPSPAATPEQVAQVPRKGELVVTLPKPLRKRLKAKAAEHGMTSEQAVSELISVWVDG